MMSILASNLCVESQRPRRARLSVWLALGVVLTSACGLPEVSPDMLPGEDCLSCHDGRSGQRWTVAGTVFGDPNAGAQKGLEGAEVLITGADGSQLTLRTNGSGNFYTAEPLWAPLTVQVQGNGVRVGMSESLTTGSCNACHRAPDSQRAPGRIYLPNP